MDWGVENGDLGGGHFFMKNHTLYEVNNNNFIYSTKKRDVNVPNIYAIKDTGLKDGGDFYVMLPTSILGQ